MERQMTNDAAVTGSPSKIGDSRGNSKVAL